jgi:hypothetical protein
VVVNGVLRRECAPVCKRKTANISWKWRFADLLQVISESNQQPDHPAKVIQQGSFVAWWRELDSGGTYK